MVGQEGKGSCRTHWLAYRRLPSPGDRLAPLALLAVVEEAEEMEQEELP